MQFGLFNGARTTLGEKLSDQAIYDHYVQYFTEADRLGYYSAFLVEHHFTGFGQLSATLTFHSHLAALTKRLRLGTAVTVLPWHNPALLVEQASTVDTLSHGRLDLGVGRGYRLTEYEGFGMSLDEGNERYMETLAFIRRAWTATERFSFPGKFWKYDNILLEPAPVQRPHPPLWIGAATHDSIRRAAEGGFNVLIGQHEGPKAVAAKVAVYREAVEKSGRTYDPLSIGCTRALHIVDSAKERDEAHKVRLKFMRNVQHLSYTSMHGNAPSSHFRNYGSDDEIRTATEDEALIGPTSEIVERLEEYRDLGVEYLLLIDVTASLPHLRQFATEVMPKFSQQSGPAVPRAALAAAGT